MSWLADVLVRYAVIIAAIWLAMIYGGWVWPACVFVVGVAQHAILVRGHEAAHGHVNPALAALCFWPFLIGLPAYRRFHFAHHRNLGTSADPEIRHKGLTPSGWRIEANRPWLFVCDLFGGAVRDVVLALWFLRPMSWRDVVGPAVVAVVAVVVLPWQAMAVWFGAVFTSMFACFRQRAFTEHVGTTGTHRMTRPALWKRLLYLPCGTWLHWEHHAAPSQPYSQL